eukprot:CAMPEP_0178436906 /NCGR_PEP_ID=MMETSP0689_2-20121128/34687_1 /TAXON_ID=160604 /ORGANISM="Amphidinium massartii, Strain CS-259" /LENGTH=200 /DNA_ID=CAMNT_0020059029 /DNA_START=1 /DNA_END=600 /DNA_ORIENTATION=+
MPQLQKSNRVGLALDLDFTQQPTGVHLKTGQYVSREHRARARDYHNMKIGENRPNNVLDDAKWRGHGFAGHVQFVPYFGKKEIRPGEKLMRDIQIATVPLDNLKPLNTTMMGRSKDSLEFTRDISGETIKAHKDGLDVLRKHWSKAVHAEHHDNPHVHFRNPIDEVAQGQVRLQEVTTAVKRVRPAGLTCINPRMGTCGS